MKKFLVVFFAALICTTCKAQRKKINVSINTNLEVINALTIPLYPEMLEDSASNPWLFANTQLMRLANRYFQPYYNHVAVQKSKFLIDKLGSGIYLLSLYYEDLPKVQRKSPIPEIIWTEVSKNRDSALMIIDEFFDAASSFYKTSNFNGFFSSYKSVYKQSLEEVKRNLPGNNFIPLLEKYYGDSKAGYNIILMPFFKSDWGMGWEIENGSQSKSIYNIASPFDKQLVLNNRVQLVGYENPEKISNLSIHEFGHSFVNPVTASEPYFSGIAGFNNLYKQIESEKQYSDWPTLFNEYIVRAGEILVMRQLGNHELAEKIKSKYKDWIYLDFFEAQMKAYTNKRNNFPSFKSFLPTLINNLATLR